MSSIPLETDLQSSVKRIALLSCKPNDQALRRASPIYPGDFRPDLGYERNRWGPGLGLMEVTVGLPLSSWRYSACISAIGGQELHCKQYIEPQTHYGRYRRKTGLERQRKVAALMANRAIQIRLAQESEGITGSAN